MQSSHTKNVMHNEAEAMVWAQNPSYLGGLGRRISEFEPSMVYIEFQDCQSYIDPKKNKDIKQNKPTKNIGGG